VSKKTTKVFDNAAVVAKNVATAAGLRPDQEEVDRRSSICNGCEEFTGTTCKKCGCYMKFKTQLKAAKCPLKKW
jgi:hypothetical protein